MSAVALLACFVKCHFYCFSLQMPIDYSKLSPDVLRREIETMWHWQQSEADYHEAVMQYHLKRRESQHRRNQVYHEFYSTRAAAISHPLSPQPMSMDVPSQSPDPMKISPFKLPLQQTTNTMQLTGATFESHKNSSSQQKSGNNFVVRLLRKRGYDVLEANLDQGAAPKKQHCLHSTGFEIHT